MNPSRIRKNHRFARLALRGINHEGVQNAKTAERLGLLSVGAQAFYCLDYQPSAFSIQLLDLADS